MRISTDVDMYRKVYLIRRAEKAIKTYYPEDYMKTPMHMSEGSEAVVAGVCCALSDSDQVYGSYRSHALYLAKTENIDGFFGEMYGRTSGIAKGKSGSMHLSEPSKGHMISSAVVASSIPLAVGNAFANQYKNNGCIAVAFFGDGAIDEGNFWESFNMACLLKVPIIFVCEDNGWSVHTPKKQRHGYDCIDNIARQFHCRVLHSDSTDVKEIHRLAMKAREIIENEHIPVFMRLEYFRHLEHVGIGLDFNAGYRSPDMAWLERDPVEVARSHLAEEIALEVEKNVNMAVELAVLKAKSASLSESAELYKDVFCATNHLL